MADFARALISKIIMSQDIEAALAVGIEDSWFDDSDVRRIFGWIVDYNQRYGESPTATALKREYPNFKPLQVPETYQYYLDRFIAVHWRALAVDAINDASEALDSDDPVRALNIFGRTAQWALVDASSNGISSVLASEVTPRSVKWIWAGRIPQGKLVVIGGDSGQGKTTIVMDLIARLSRGEKLPAMKRPHKPMRCLIMTAEDDLADTLVPRLHAADADLGNIEFILGRKSPDGDVLLNFPQDIDRLRNEVVRTNARLLVIDPFNAFLNGKTDSYKDADIRRVLAPLSRLAEDTGAAVLLIFHLKKSQSGKALHQIVGSVGIGAAARAVLVVAPNPLNEDERLLAVAKVSNAAERKSLVFRIEGSEPYGAAKARWLGLSDFTADQLVSSHQPGDKSALAVAEDFLSRLLIREGGQMAVSQIVAEADAVNIAEATLRRAKKSLGVKSRKSKGKEGAIWIWYLPEHHQTESPGSASRTNA